MNLTKLVKRGYSGIPLLTVPIQTKRARLLNDAGFISACEVIHAGVYWIPDGFDKAIQYTLMMVSSYRQVRQIKSKTGRELLRSAYTAGQMGESFETWKKSLLK